MHLAGSIIPLAQDKLWGLDPQDDGSAYKEYMDATDPTLSSAEQYWHTDPDEDVGTGAKVLGGVGRIVLPLAAGGGNPSLMVASETTLGAQEALEHGASANQAVGIGIVQGAAAGVGAFAPAAVGKTVVAKVASGAAINAGLGIATRAGQNAIAGDNKELSDLYDPFDSTSLATDIGMGATFGAVAAIAGRRRTAPLEQQDAITDAEIQQHTNNLINGEPVSANAANQHQRNLNQAETALKTGQAVKTVMPDVRAKRVSIVQQDGISGSGVEANLMGLLLKKEGAGSFDTPSRFTKIPPSKPLTQMTVNEVLRWQEANRSAGADSTAAGGFQIIYKTLSSLKGKMQLSGAELFDKTMQERMAIQLMKGRGLDDFKAGKISADDFADNLASEWAVLQKRNGKGAHDGDGLNKSLVSRNILMGVLSDKLHGGTAYTASGDGVQYAYDVVPADSLITSHDNDLNINALYPQELQPRDRTRAASQLQIESMASDINPYLLGDSPTVTDGAPIIGFDDVVESGNARSIAMRRAYGEGKMEAYQQYIMDNAERFGLNRADIEGITNPVLVRRRLSDVDRVEFAKRANESTIATMGTAERTKTDITRLPSAELLQVNADGALNIAGSTDYVRQFVQAMPENERAMMMTGDGRLSQDGKRRIESALVQQAYGDSALVERLSENIDDNSRNILNALLKNAGSLVQLNELARQGGRVKNNLSADLAQAVAKYSDIKAAGQNVSDYFGQGQLIDDGLSAGAREALQVMGDNSRSAKAVGEYIQNKINEIEAQGDPRQGGLFDSAAEQGIFTETPEQQIALSALQQHDIQLPTGELDADGNPVMVSAKGLFEQLGSEQAIVNEQTKATDIAISCALMNGV